MKSKIVSIMAILAIALTGCSSSSSQTENIKTSEKQGERTTTVTTTTPTPTSKITEKTSSAAQVAEKIPDEKIPDISDKREDISLVWGKGTNSYRTVDVDYHTMSQQLGLSLADNEERRLTLKSLDVPFYFDGIAIGKTDKVQKEENDSIVTYTTAKEGAIAFVELGEPVEIKNNFSGYTDYPVNSIAFDIDNTTKDENFTFLREYIDRGEYTESFELGDKKEKVEDLLGKGYEQNGYAFYKGANRDKKKVYFIVHYADDSTVKQVFIIGRDSLYDLKGRKVDI